MKTPSGQGDGFGSYIPVWNSANQAAIAFQDGRYIDALAWEVHGFIELTGLAALTRAIFVNVAQNAAKIIGTNAAKTSTSLVSSGELLRIENAATRIGKPITVVGSRAIPGRVSNGVNVLTGNMADWDYVIPGLNSKNWSTIKNSLPGARSILDNTPRNIDILPGPVWPGSPHITIYPR